MQRIQKVIANSGYLSRRKAEDYIKDGKVKVNGKVVDTLGMKVDYSDIIEIEGNVINKENQKVYYLLNKPRGIISSVSDEKGRKTVIDLIDTDEKIYPIGRLDYDTTGIILLTNDGELTNYLTHPSNNIEKVYLAKIEGILDKDAINKLKKPIIIDGKKTIVKRFKVTRKDIKRNTCFVERTIVEGRNHIVKNIFKELGYSVEKLTRVAYDFLTLDGLASGDYRQLTIKEVKKLYRK